VHSIKRAIISASDVALVFLKVMITAVFNCLPRCGVERNANRALGRRLSVKQEIVFPILDETMAQIECCIKTSFIQTYCNVTSHTNSNKVTSPCV